MSQIDVSLDELLPVLERLFADINKALTYDQRKLLLSFKAFKARWPEWMFWSSKCSSRRSEVFDYWRWRPRAEAANLRVAKPRS